MGSAQWIWTREVPDTKKEWGGWRLGGLWSVSESWSAISERGYLLNWNLHASSTLSHSTQPKEWLTSSVKCKLCVVMIRSSRILRSCHLVVGLGSVSGTNLPWWSRQWHWLCCSRNLMWSWKDRLTLWNLLRAQQSTQRTGCGANWGRDLINRKSDHQNAQEAIKGWASQTFLGLFFPSFILLLIDRSSFSFHRLEVTRAVQIQRAKPLFPYLELRSDARIWCSITMTPLWIYVIWDLNSKSNAEKHNEHFVACVNLDVCGLYGQNWFAT